MLAPLRNADFVVLVCDLTDKTSLSNVRPYFDKAMPAVPSAAVFFLLGNKCDLEERRQITLENLQAFAEKISITNVLEVSAKTGAGLEELRYMLVEALSRHSELEPATDERSSNVIDLHHHRTQETKCC
jgi:GTPase SAR1 family protein